jgi:Xaa-Pro aminopeptidase
MEKKIQKLQNKMKKSGIGVLLVTRPEELILFFDHYPYWGKSVGVFYLDGTRQLFIPNNEPDINEYTKKWKESVVFNDPAEVLELLTKEINEKKLTSFELGVTYLPSNSSPTSLAAEQGGFSSSWWKKIWSLPVQKIIDTQDFYQEFYQEKSLLALDNIKRTNEIAEAGIDRFYHALKVGNREIDVKNMVENEIQSVGLSKYGVKNINVWSYIQSGENTVLSGTFNRTSGKQLNEGDYVLLELAVCVEGYWCDITRTGVVVVPTDTQNKYYSIVRKAQEEAYKKIKIGGKYSEAYKAAKGVIVEEGLGDLFNHALGHGVGYQYHENSGFIDANSTKVFKKDSIITIEPGIYSELISGGIRIEENVLVTEEGFEILTYPRLNLSGDK